MIIFLRVWFTSLILAANSFAMSQDDNSSGHEFSNSLADYYEPSDYKGEYCNSEEYKDYEIIYPSSSSDTLFELTKEEKELLMSLRYIKKDCDPEILCKIIRLNRALYIMYGAEYYQYLKNIRDENSKLLDEKYNLLTRFERLKEHFIQGNNPFDVDPNDLEAGNQDGLQMEYLNLVFKVMTRISSENSDYILRDGERDLFRAALQCACGKILELSEEENFDDQNMFLFLLVHELQGLEVTHEDLSNEHARELLSVASEIDLDEEIRANFIYSIISLTFPRNIMPTSFLQWYVFLNQNVKYALLGCGAGAGLTSSVLLVLNLICGGFSECDLYVPLM